MEVTMNDSPFRTEREERDRPTESLSKSSTIFLFTLLAISIVESPWELARFNVKIKSFTKIFENLQRPFETNGKINVRKGEKRQRKEKKKF